MLRTCQNTKKLLKKLAFNKKYSQKLVSAMLKLQKITENCVITISYGQELPIFIQNFNVL